MESVEDPMSGKRQGRVLGPMRSFNAWVDTAFDFEQRGVCMRVLVLFVAASQVRSVEAEGTKFSVSSRSRDELQTIINLRTLGVQQRNINLEEYYRYSQKA